MNKEFRGKNYHTNVLSFPDTEIDFNNILEFKPNNDYFYLGDIAFCNEVIEEESAIQNISFQDHFTHLTIHSMLHLLGFDHQNDKEASAMEKLEVEILKKFGISSPY